MKDLMIDLETMGNKSYAAIIQIGACFFDQMTGEIGRKYSINIDLQSALDRGLRVNGDTIYWWLQQSEDARKSILPMVNGEIVSHDIVVALSTFMAFVTAEKTDDFVGAERVWSHSGFDYNLLQDAFEVCKLPWPFHYRAPKDIRTLTYCADIDPKSYKSDGLEHNALDDAIFQVRYVCDCLKKIREALAK